MGTGTERQLTEEANAKRLLSLNEPQHVALAVQLRIARALERIADAMIRKD